MYQGSRRQTYKRMGRLACARGFPVRILSNQTIAVHYVHLYRGLCHSVPSRRQHCGERMAIQNWGKLTNFLLSLYFPFTLISQLLSPLYHIQAHTSVQSQTQIISHNERSRSRFRVSCQGSFLVEERCPPLRKQHWVHRRRVALSL